LREPVPVRLVALLAYSLRTYALPVPAAVRFGSTVRV